MKRAGIAAVLATAFLFSSCFNESNRSFDADEDAFGKYSAAMASNDAATIEAGIRALGDAKAAVRSRVEDVDQKLAQLYFKAGREAEAVAALEKSGDRLARFHLATLLLRLGRKADAEPILSALLEENLKTYYGDSAVERKPIAKLVIVETMLLGRDAEPFVKEAVGRGVITDVEAKAVRLQWSDAEATLAALWPR